MTIVAKSILAIIQKQAEVERKIKMLKMSNQTKKNLITKLKTKLNNSTLHSNLKSLQPVPSDVEIPT